MTKRTTLLSLLMLTTFSAFAGIDLTENLRLSGFGSTSWAQSDNETPLIINRDVSDETCWDCDTTFGLQLDYYSDSFTASTQVVKRPQDYWSNPEIEWAYIGYTFGELELRAGRQRMPIFLFSEYYYVGHAYQSARPPEELYNSVLGITAYNGVNLVWNHNIFDDYQITLTPFVAFDDDNTIAITDSFELDVNVKSIVGANAIVAGDYFRWNFTYFDGRYDQTFRIKNPAPNIPLLVQELPDRRFELFSFGAEYELGEWTLTAERQLANVRSTWYAMATYRIDQFSPYLLYGETKTKRTDITDFDGKSGSSFVAGLRYDVRQNISINVEWQHFKSFGNQRGAFIVTPVEPDAKMHTLMFNFVF